MKNSQLVICSLRQLSSEMRILPLVLYLDMLTAALCKRDLVLGVVSLDEILHDGAGLEQSCDQSESVVSWHGRDSRT